MHFQYVIHGLHISPDKDQPFSQVKDLDGNLKNEHKQSFVKEDVR